MASTPDPVDPKRAADAQFKSNVNATAAGAIVNNYDEIGPGGTVEYNKIGKEKVDGVKVPRYQRVVTLDPAQQALYDQQNELSWQMNDFAGQQMDRLGNVLSEPVDFGFSEQARKDYQDALMARQQPWLDQDERNLDSKLVNEGFQRGTDEYESAMNQYSQRLNDARLAAVLGGSQEQAHQIQMALADRNQTVNELGALMAGGQVSIPQFTGPYQQGIAAAPIAENMYRSNAQAAANAQATNQGLFSLGGSVAGGLFGLAGDVWGRR